MSGEILFASGARTATPPDAVVSLKRDGRVPSDGIIVVIDVTAIIATPSITVDLKYLDPASGDKQIILTSAAITSASTVILKISPHLAAVANLVAKDIVPEQLHVGVTHADADSITYSIGLIHA